MIATLDDEVNLLGQAPGRGWSLRPQWATSGLSFVHELLNPVWTEPEGATRFDRYFSIETDVRNLIRGLERALGLVEPPVET